MKSIFNINIILIVLMVTSCEERIPYKDEIVLNEMVIEKDGKYYFGDCEDHATSLYTGSNSYFYENGKVKGNFTIKNGLPDGHWEQFDSTGMKKIDLYFNYGKLIKKIDYKITN